MNPERENKNFAAEKKSNGGLMCLWNAFTYSMAGFKAALKYEHACRQEMMLFVPATILALCLPIGAYEKLALIVSLILIIALEMANSALEACVDDISLEYRELAKRAKDLGSATVFCAMVIAALVWGTIIYVNFIR